MNLELQELERKRKLEYKKALAILIALILLFSLYLYFFQLPYNLDKSATVVLLIFSFPAWGLLLLYPANKINALAMKAILENKMHALLGPDWSWTQFSFKTPFSQYHFDLFPLTLSGARTQKAWVAGTFQGKKAFCVNYTLAVRTNRFFADRWGFQGLIYGLEDFNLPGGFIVQPSDYRKPSKTDFILMTQFPGYDVFIDKDQLFMPYTQKYLNTFKLIQSLFPEKPIHMIYRNNVFFVLQEMAYAIDPMYVYPNTISITDSNYNAKLESMVQKMQKVFENLL